MKFKITMMVAAILIGPAILCADEAAKSDKPKTVGVEVVPDTAVTVLQKMNSWLQGNLEFTMSEDPNKYKKMKDDHTVNAIGQKVPKATGGR